MTKAITYHVSHGGKLFKTGGRHPKKAREYLILDYTTDPPAVDEYLWMVTVLSHPDFGTRPDFIILNGHIAQLIEGTGGKWWYRKISFGKTSDP